MKAADPIANTGGTITAKGSPIHLDQAVTATIRIPSGIR